MQCIVWRQTTPKSISISEHLKHLTIPFDNSNIDSSLWSHWCWVYCNFHIYSLWKWNCEVDVLNVPVPDVKLILLQMLFSSGALKTHKHIYYYLCKHVILLSNEPFTVSIMKQLALARAKWTSEISHVYAARWKQMFHNPNTGITHSVLQRNRRDFESASFSSAHWLH